MTPESLPIIAGVRQVYDRSAEPLLDRDLVDLAGDAIAAAVAHAAGDDGSAFDNFEDKTRMVAARSHVLLDRQGPNWNSYRLQ